MNKIWYYARACLETLIQAGLIVLFVIIFEQLGLMMIYIVDYSIFFKSFAEVGMFIDIIIIIIIMFIPNILFVYFHYYTFKFKTIKKVVINLFLIALLETAVFIACVYGLFLILDFVSFLKLTIINFWGFFILTFCIILITNFIFNIVFSYYYGHLMK